MAYVVTKFSKYHSNVLGSTVERSHPDFVQLPDDKTYCVNQDMREDALWRNSEVARAGKMVELFPGIAFKILSAFDNDCNRSGSTIRWKVPKGSKLIWRKWDYDNESYGDITKEQVV